MSYKLSRSTRKDKKYMVVLPDNKKIHFGAAGYSDFTINKDVDRKKNYILRHQINEDWGDLKKAGTWSRFILWNKETIKDSVKDMEKRFNIKII